MSLNQFHFRDATLNDVEKLQALGLASYGQYANILTEDNWKLMQTNLKRAELYPDLLNTSKGFVCEHGEKIVGMAFLVRSGNPTDIYQENWSYIRMVGIEPSYSGKGIAKHLTSLCISHAKETGEKIVCLHTSEIMHAARHIYEKLGFTVLKEIPKKFGIRYWLFKLDLDTQSKCTECGTAFHCGNKDEKPCWCSELPNIVPMESSSCLCPSCLEKKIIELQLKRT